MKHQPRPFVVEVKRGTSRHAFRSNDTSFNKAILAEKLLFQSSVPDAGQAKVDIASPTLFKLGRVLPVLSEPEPIVVADLPILVRRGRKPGSKNKPRSKHPKPQPEMVTPTSTVQPVAAATGDRQLDRVLPETATSPDPTPIASARPARFRERSLILKRYVFGTEPQAGQRGRLRAKKAGRRR